MSLTARGEGSKIGPESAAILYCLNVHETGSLTLRGARGQKRPKNSSHTKCMTLLEFYLKWFFLHQWYYAAHRDQHCKKQFSLITNVVAQSFLEAICWFEHSSSPADSGYCPPLKRRKAQKNLNKKKKAKNLRIFYIG